MVKTAQPTRRSSTGARFLGVCAAGAVMLRSYNAFTMAPQGALAPAKAAVQLRAVSSPVSQVANPIKTVSETVADFYKAYPQPPILPMYRTFLVDTLTSTHLAMVDARFKYDAVFALGVREYYNGLMGSYDKIMMGAPESEKIWKAFCSSLGLDAAKVSADADAALSFAGSSSPADILSAMEGTTEASEKAVAEAFKSITSSLYSQSFSIGLFKMMEKANVEVSKANVEEWAKALKLKPAVVTSDLETYKLNQKKLQAGEEMLREIEIREKKKLAQQLEEKAKALAAKAAGKTEGSEEKEKAMA